MTFIHIADMHLDMPFIALQGNKKLIKKKKIEQRFAFQKVIDLAIKNNTDFFRAEIDLVDSRKVIILNNDNIILLLL